MRKVLILFAHPKYEQSVINKAMVEIIQKCDTKHITFHDLYERYPDFNIDIEREQKLLTDHDIIVWHHPFYWYSCPPLLKQWIDMVLEFGWAYGPDGVALKDKIIFNTITTGGTNEAYQESGRNRFTLRQFLIPFEQTARLCKMIYLPPFAIQGTHRLTTEDMKVYSKGYRELLDYLVEDGHNTSELSGLKILNDKFINN